MGGITAEKLTKAYIKIREERAKLSAEYKEKDSKSLDVPKKYKD